MMGGFTILTQCLFSSVAGVWGLEVRFLSGSCPSSTSPWQPERSHSQRARFRRTSSCRELTERTKKTWKNAEKYMENLQFGSCKLSFGQSYVRVINFFRHVHMVGHHPPAPNMGHGSIPTKQIRVITENGKNTLHASLFPDTAEWVACMVIVYQTATLLEHSYRAF